MRDKSKHFEKISKENLSDPHAALKSKLSTPWIKPELLIRIHNSPVGLLLKGV